jgi:hypothetical protein
MIAAVTMCVSMTAVAAGQRDPQSPSEQQQSESAVSADRIRDGLRRPALQLPELPPPPVTFRSGVEVKLETPLDVIRRELQEAARVHFRTPVTRGLAEVDVLPALVGLVNKIKAIRRQHAEAEARTMVEQELAEFCSTHDCSDIEREPITEGVIVP